MNWFTGAGKDQDAGGVFVAAFGKHPAWEDHLDDLGLETSFLVDIKRILYVEGVGGAIASGAWERAEPSQRIEKFAHLFVWAAAADIVIGRMWSSQDAKGRALYPMVVCTHCSGLPLAWAFENVPLLLEELEHRCVATRSASEVIAAVDEARQLLRQRAALCVAGGPEPEGAATVFQTLAACPEMGPDHRGLLRVLYQAEQSMEGFFPSAPRASESGTLPEPQQIRVPQCNESPAAGALLWLRFMRCLVDRGAPVLLVVPLREPWLDVLVGAPRPSQLECIRATAKALPLTTEIPFQLDEDFVKRSESRIAGTYQVPPVTASRRRRRAPPRDPRPGVWARLKAHKSLIIGVLILIGLCGLLALGAAVAARLLARQDPSAALAGKWNELCGQYNDWFESFAKNVDPDFLRRVNRSASEEDVSSVRRRQQDWEGDAFLKELVASVAEFNKKRLEPQKLEGLPSPYYESALRWDQLEQQERELIQKAEIGNESVTTALKIVKEEIGDRLTSWPALMELANGEDCWKQTWPQRAEYLRYLGKEINRNKDLAVNITTVLKMKALIPHVDEGLKKVQGAVTTINSAPQAGNTLLAQFGVFVKAGIAEKPEKMKPAESLKDLEDLDKRLQSWTEGQGAIAVLLEGFVKGPWIKTIHRECVAKFPPVAPPARATEEDFRKWMIAVDSDDYRLLTLAVGDEQGLFSSAEALMNSARKAQGLVGDQGSLTGDLKGKQATLVASLKSMDTSIKNAQDQLSALAGQSWCKKCYQADGVSRKEAILSGAGALKERATSLRLEAFNVAVDWLDTATTEKARPWTESFHPSVARPDAVGALELQIADLRRRAGNLKDEDLKKAFQDVESYLVENPWGGWKKEIDGLKKDNETLRLQNGEEAQKNDKIFQEVDREARGMPPPDEKMAPHDWKSHLVVIDNIKSIKIRLSGIQIAIGDPRKFDEWNAGISGYEAVVAEIDRFAGSLTLPPEAKEGKKSLGSGVEETKKLIAGLPGKEVPWEKMANQAKVAATASRVRAGLKDAEDRAKPLGEFGDAVRKLETDASRIPDSIAGIPSKAVNGFWGKQRETLVTEARKNLPYDPAAINRSADLLKGNAGKLEALLMQLSETLAATEADWPKEIKTRWNGGLWQWLVDQREKQFGEAVKKLDQLDYASLPSPDAPGAAGLLDKILEPVVRPLLAECRAASEIATRFDGQFSGMLKDLENGDISGSVPPTYAKVVGAPDYPKLAAGVFASVEGRVNALKAISKTDNVPDLVKYTQSPRVNAWEAAWAAWWKLGKTPDWPKTSEQLAEERDIRNRLTSVGAPADTVIAQGCLRWERYLIRLQGEKAIAAAIEDKDLKELDPAKINLATTAAPELVRLSTPLARYRLLRWAWTKVDLEKIDDDELETKRDNFVRLVRTHAGEVAQKEPVKSFLVELEKVTRDEKKGEGDVTNSGPGAVGWQLDQGDPTKETVVWRHPGRKDIALTFVRVKPPGSTGCYLCTTEVSVGLMQTIVNAPEVWPQVSELEPFKRIIGAKSSWRQWQGPRPWRIKPDGSGLLVSERWLTETVPPDIAYPPQLKDKVPDPTAGHPMNDLSPDAAVYFARLLGCRLPTAAEWKAACQVDKAQARRNLRDAGWASQRDYAAKRPTILPDEHIFFPDGIEVAKGLDAVVRADAPDDGCLWFAEVDSDKDNVFHHLVGNVAEYVLEDPARGQEVLPVGAKLQASQVQAFVNSTKGAGLAVIGGSALSPPEVKVDEPYPCRLLKARDAFSDVGFRLAFTASQPRLRARVVELLKSEGGRLR